MQAERLTAASISAYTWVLTSFTPAKHILLSSFYLFIFRYELLQLFVYLPTKPFDQKK